MVNLKNMLQKIVVKRIKFMSKKYFLLSFVLFLMLFKVDIASASVVLSWANPVDTDYTQVVIYRGSTAISTPTGTPLAVVDGTTTSTYRDSDVQPSTVYVYTLFTRDIDGVYSDPQSITFTTAAAPTVSSSRGGGGGGGGSRNTVQTTIQQCPTGITSSGQTVFTRNLTIGSRGDDVKALQVLLNKIGFIIASSGNGSVGNESTYFGPATKDAVIRFQNAYASEILVASGVSKATGFVGPATIKKLNSLNNSSSSSSGATVQCIPNVNNTNGTQVNNVNPISGTVFTRNLTVGSRGDDVKALQVFLNSRGFKVALTGNGSVGKESTYFGPATKTALAKFQAANGITPASGYFGPKTRAIIK